MDSPLSIGLPAIAATRSANSAGRPSRLGNGIVLPSASRAGSGSAASSGVSNRPGAIALTLASIYLLAWPVLHASDRLIRRIGTSRVGVASRVLGIVLAALAVQYVFDGITGYVESLPR